MGTKKFDTSCEKIIRDTRYRNRIAAGNLRVMPRCYVYPLRKPIRDKALMSFRMWIVEVLILFVGRLSGRLVIVTRRA